MVEHIQVSATNQALLEVQGRANTVHELLLMLRLAMPEDEADCGAPVRRVVSHLVDLADALSDAVMRLPVALADTQPCQPVDD